MRESRDSKARIEMAELAAITNAETLAINGCLGVVDVGKRFLKPRRRPSPGDRPYIRRRRIKQNVGRIGGRKSIEIY